MVEVDQIGSKPDAEEEIEKWKSENCQCARCTGIFTNSFQIVLSCFPLVLHRLDILVL